VDKTLQRLVAEGVLRRLSRGLYDKPRHHDLLGTLWPSVDAIVKAIAGLRTQPTRVYAVNMLGLAETSLALPPFVELMRQPAEAQATLNTP
jgi:hypothetical protein